MRARAPGKLLLSGAYAVLDGAPAIVCAVDRWAWAAREGAGAEGAAPAVAPAEVRAAMPQPPHIDTRALASEEGVKLGLGSSAAGLVAALALRAAEGGADVSEAATRARIFTEARAVHARVQGGGSGVDVAASVYGGVLRYRATSERPPLAAALPPGLRFAAYFSGQSARTSDLRARVDALRTRSASDYDRVLAPLLRLANAADDAVAAGSASDFITALRGTARALADLGAAADAPIVPPAFAELAAEAALTDGAAFLPSGAGGGDVGVFVGTQDPPASFVVKAERLAMRQVHLAIDPAGVVVVAS